MPTYEITTADGKVYEVDLGGSTQEPPQPADDHFGFFGSVPESQYARGERNVAGNLLDRPAAATRGFLQGLAPGGPNPVENYVRGSVNPASIPTFQDLAIERYYQGVAERNPGQDPNFAQTLGGMVPSAVGLAADTVVNPANLLPAFLSQLKPMQAVGEVVAGSPAGQAVGRVLTKERHLPNLGNIPDFLRGNTKAVGTAETALEQAAHQAVKSVRPGGKLHQRVFETIARESENAWAPMKQVVQSIDAPIAIDEVKAAAAANLADEPARLQAVNVVLDSIKESRKTPALSAQDWSDISTEIGGFMRKAAVRGTAARSFADMVYADARSAIANIIEQKAPLELQGNVALAKQQWANYAADRDALFKLFHPSGTQNLNTDTGMKFLKSLSLGNGTPAQNELMARFAEKSGVDLPASIRPYAEALLKARISGTRGKALAKYGAKALKYGAIALGAERVFRR